MKAVRWNPDTKVRVCMTPVGLFLDGSGMPGRLAFKQDALLPADGSRGSTFVEATAFATDYAGGSRFATDSLTDRIQFIGESADENAALDGAMFTMAGGRVSQVLMMPRAVLESARGGLGCYPRDAQVIKTLEERAQAPLHRRLLQTIGGTRAKDDVREVTLIQYDAWLPDELLQRLEYSGHGTMEVSRMPGGALMVTFMGRSRGNIQPVQLEGAPRGDAAFLFDRRLVAIEAADPADRETLRGECFTHFDGRLRYSYLYVPADALKRATWLTGGSMRSVESAAYLDECERVCGAGAGKGVFVAVYAADWQALQESGRSVEQDLSAAIGRLKRDVAHVVDVVTTDTTCLYAFIEWDSSAEASMKRIVLPMCFVGRSTAWALGAARAESANREELKRAWDAARDLAMGRSEVEGPRELIALY